MIDERCQNYDFCFNESSILKSILFRPFSQLKIGIQHLLDACMPPYELDLPEFNGSFRPSTAFVAFLRPSVRFFYIKNFLLILVLWGVTFIKVAISAISRLKNSIPGVKFQSLCSNSSPQCSTQQLNDAPGMSEGGLGRDQILS